MIKDFDALKEQLRELADLVNSFKSEAVQLRLVELIFEERVATTQRSMRTADGSTGPERKRRPGTKVGKADTQSSQPSRSRSSRLGGKAVLARLYSEGFFKSAKTINDLVQHADAKLATKLRQSDLSGGLARYVRDGKLNRNKNADNQYEYVQA